MSDHLVQAIQSLLKVSQQADAAYSPELGLYLACDLGTVPGDPICAFTLLTVRLMRCYHPLSLSHLQVARGQVNARRSPS